jgi:hypothetical protein
VEIDGWAIHGQRAVPAAIPANVTGDTALITMYLTFNEVKQSSIANITSASPDDPQFGQYIQEAVKRLLTRGDWAGTVVPIHTCVSRGCVVWPRYVDHVRRITTCRGNIPLHGMFYDFLDWRDRKYHRDDFWIGGGGRRNCVNKGWSPVFQDIPGDGYFVRMYVEAAEDYGSTLTLFGVDNNNQPLRTRNIDGLTWSDGWVLTAQYPYAQTTGVVRRIGRVVRESTQCNATLFAVGNVSVNTYQFGFLYNIDTGITVSVTIDGLPGSQSINLGGEATPSSNTIGSVWNYDQNAWVPIVARGQPGFYYIDFGQPAQNTNLGGQVYNPTTLQFENIIARGPQGSQYLEVGTFAAPNTSTTNMFPLAEYEPSDTNPKFLKQELHLPCCNGNSFSNGVVALVKLRQIQPVNPNDIIIIPSIPALKLGVQAVIANEAGEIQQEQAYILAAVEQLNRELEDWCPLDQVPVSFGELGHTRIGQTKMF